MWQRKADQGKQQSKNNMILTNILILKLWLDALNKNVRKVDEWPSEVEIGFQRFRRSGSVESDSNVSGGPEVWSRIDFTSVKVKYTVMTPFVLA